MKTKYTADGKKVRIVGKLNNQETIVQEIYVTDGNEIPSGENFVTKTILDYPAKSWKEERLAKINKEYETMINEYDSLEKELKRQRTFLLKKLSFTKDTISNISSDVFSTLSDFLAGAIEYLVDDYYQILSFDKAIENEFYGDKSLRLVSLYGNSKGDLSYKINTYSDGSGGEKPVIPCKTYEEATYILKKRINKAERYNSNIIRAIVQHKIPYDKEKYQAYMMAEKEKLKKEIEKREQEIINYQTRIDKMEH